MSWADGYTNQCETREQERDRVGHGGLAGGRGCLACEFRMKRDYQGGHKSESVPKKWGNGARCGYEGGRTLRPNAGFFKKKLY